MKKILVIFIIFISFIGAVLSLKENKTQESIIYFPIDPKVSFQTAYTSLKLLNKPQNNQYTLKWDISSSLDKEAYLRQDVGLLFSNGKLVDGVGKWIENSKGLKQEKNIFSQGSAYFQGLTFHHAELHEKGDKIFSAQAMSGDQLYVIHTPFTPLSSFRTANSIAEKEWKERLDQKTSTLLENSWEKGIKKYSINLNQYHAYPLTQFYLGTNHVVPGFSQEKSKMILGRLWEGLYKNYFLGIKKADGTMESPIGSTLPLILLSKDKTHLLVLIETAKGDSIILRQKIESDH